MKINEKSLVHDDINKVVDQIITVRQGIESTMLFDPNKPLKVLWDLIVGLLIIYSIITVPFKIAFEIFDSPGMKVVVTRSFIRSNSFIYSFILLIFIGR